MLSMQMLEVRRDGRTRKQSEKCRIDFQLTIEKITRSSTGFSLDIRKRSINLTWLKIGKALSCEV